MIVKKWVLKLLSILFALLLWFYVTNSEQFEVEQKLPLVVIRPTNMDLINFVPKEITVRMKGARIFLNQINPNKNKVFIDLKKYSNRKRFTVKIRESNVIRPFSVKITKIIPEKIEFKLEKQLKKYVPVIPSIIGKLSSSLKLVNKKINPDKILIKGAYSVIKNISLVKTAPIDLLSLESNVDRVKIPLGEIDSRVSFGDGTEELKEVEFLYNIRPNRANLTLKNVKVSIVSQRPVIKGWKRKVSIDVLVPKHNTKRLKSSDIKVLAEIPPSARGRVKVKLKTILPDGVHLLKIHPQFIQVLVKE